MAITTIDNILLSQSPRLKITGGPNFSTTLTRTQSGWRSGNANWGSALWKFTIKYIEKAEDFQDIIAFWLGRVGPAYAFLISDPADNSDGGNGAVKLIDGEYRLVKNYPDEIRPYTRIITRPINPVTLSGVSGTPVVDYTTGIVSGATSEGTWTGSFYVPVAFMSDSMDYDFKPAGANGYMEWDVHVEEVRVSS